MKIVCLDQDGSAWHEWRNAGLGSSDAASILGVSPWKDARSLWDEKRLALSQQKSSSHCPEKVASISDTAAKEIRARITEREGKNVSSKSRGKYFEPKVRAMYEDWTGRSCPPLCAQHNQYSFMKASFDGYDSVFKGGAGLVVEIKCPNRNAHDEALAGFIPDYYAPQLWHQLAVSGAGYAHYLSYHPQFPQHSRLAIVEISAEKSRQSILDLTDVEVLFWDGVINGYYPLSS